MLSPRVDVVPWLQEGCQNRLAGSVFIEEFVATNSGYSYLIKEIKVFDIQHLY